MQYQHRYVMIEIHGVGNEDEKVKTKTVSKYSIRNMCVIYMDVKRVVYVCNDASTYVVIETHAEGHGHDMVSIYLYIYIYIYIYIYTYIYIYIYIYNDDMVKTEALT